MVIVTDMSLVLKSEEVRGLLIISDTDVEPLPDMSRTPDTFTTFPVLVNLKLSAEDPVENVEKGFLSKVTLLPV
jgi:hypothetical protein